MVTRAFTDYHKDDSVRANGQVDKGLAEGYWEWFRKDGSIMRSGNFRAGVQVGEWTTYDQQGQAFKMTDKKDGDSALELTRPSTKD